MLNHNMNKINDKSAIISWQLSNIKKLLRNTKSSLNKFRIIIFLKIVETYLNKINLDKIIIYYPDSAKKVTSQIIEEMMMTPGRKKLQVMENFQEKY